MVKPRKIVILALSDGGREHHKDCETAKVTWAFQTNPNIMVAFIRISEEKNIVYKDRMLYLPKYAQYFSILEKTLLAMEWVINNWKFDLLIRTNVSTYFDFQKLLMLGDKIPVEKPIIAGYPQRTKIGLEKSIMFLNGASIIISRSGVMAMLNGIHKFNRATADDVSISVAARELKLKFLYYPRNNLSDTHFFIPSAITRVKSSHNSEAASARLLLLYNYFQSKNKWSSCISYWKIIQFEFSILKIGPKSLIIGLRKSLYCLRIYIFIWIHSIRL